MSRPFRYLLFLLIAYFIAWTASYTFTLFSRGDRLDFSYYFDYLAMGCSFRGGELPASIWLFSIIAFVPLAGLSVLLVRKFSINKT